MGELGGGGQDRHGDSERARAVGLVCVLEVQPDLTAGVPSDQLATARRQSVATVLESPPGPWPPPFGSDSRDVGLLLDGPLASRVDAAGRHTVELLGPGDVIVAGECERDLGLVPTVSRWWALETCRAAVLDREWRQRLAPWPDVYAALLCRAMQQKRSMALRLSLAQGPKLATRVLFLLWHLADRWGQVESGGVALDIKLSHALLADLACAQRESVCRALRELAKHDLLVARADGGWTLRGTSPAEVDALALGGPPTVARASHD